MHKKSKQPGKCVDQPRRFGIRNSAFSLNNFRLNGRVTETVLSSLHTSDIQLPYMLTLYITMVQLSKIRN